MTKLSGLIGFGAGGSGGGASDNRASSFQDEILLDSYSTDGTAQGKNFQSANMSAYAQPMRIRSFDTSSKAFVAYNISTRQSSSSGSGNFHHGLWLFSADQTTGAIQFEDYASALSSNSPYDYSTFERASDEWSGRYCYMGHIPRQSSPNHQYGYNAYKINWNGSSVSTSGSYSNSPSYTPSGNSTEFSYYLEPSERREGGAVTHICCGYSSGSTAQAVEFRYSYSASSVSLVNTNSSVYQNSVTSTNHNVRHLWQWDQGSQPYYDIFHNMPNGIIARTRGSNNWGLLESGGLDTGTVVFGLSTGNVLLCYTGKQYLIDTSGTKTQVTSDTVPFADAIRGSSYGAANFCWNIGQDEWIINAPGGLWVKFVINPNTGKLEKTSQIIRSDATLYKTLNSDAYRTHGLRSSSLQYSHQMFTYGTNNNSGVGYGTNKLFFIGGYNNTIHLKTYDLQLVIDKLEYLS